MVLEKREIEMLKVIACGLAFFFLMMLSFKGCSTLKT